MKHRKQDDKYFRELEEIKFLKKILKLNKPTKKQDVNIYYWNDEIAVFVSDKIKELKSQLKKLEIKEWKKV